MKQYIYIGISIFILGLSVFALGTKGNTATVSAEEAVPTEEPTDITQKKVENLKFAGEVKNDEVSFSWDKVDGVDKYEIWKFNALTNGYDMIGETDKTEYSIRELNRGTKLKILVRGYRVAENDEKIYCNYSDQLIVATKPDDMEELRVETTNSTQVVLSWKALSDDCSYMILRCVEGGSTFDIIASSDVNNYTDNTVKASTGYTYKVYAYIKDTVVITENEDNGSVDHGVNVGDPVRSDNELTVSTSTCPAPAKISYYLGGDGRVKIRWSNTITGLNSYVVYIKDANGMYNEFSRLADTSLKECILSGLARETEYQFKVVPVRVYEGVEYQSIEEASEVTVKTSGEVWTSTDASVFKKVSKLKKSKIMKSYKEFSTAVVYSRSIVMPGLKGTNINYFKVDGMVNQAVCFVEDYMLISAYNLAGQENSVVYVIDADSMKYICTIVLPSKYHVGGMAYDGNNIWISTGRAVSCFTINDVRAAVTSGYDSYMLEAYKTKCSVDTQASFVTYYKNRLWIGEHNEKISTYMYAYKIKNKDSDTPTLKQANKMKIPSRTQDVLFLSSGKMILSRSNQVSAAKSKYYISELDLYKPGKIKSSGAIKKNKRKGKLKMPPMLEGIAYKGGYLYTTYESACISNCTEKLDRIIAMKYKKIKWK